MVNETPAYTPIPATEVAVSVEGAKLFNDGAVEFNLVVDGKPISLGYFNGEFEYFSTPNEED